MFTHNDIFWIEINRLFMGGSRLSPLEQPVVREAPQREKAITLRCRCRDRLRLYTKSSSGSGVFPQAELQVWTGIWFNTTGKPLWFLSRSAWYYISGAIEILPGFGLLVPSLQTISAWGLVALFIAVFPANLNMSINHMQIAGIPDAW